MSEVTRQQFHSSGVRISYRDFGGVGTPIVLIHGLAGQGLEWTDTAITLTGRGHVVAPDLRGHGSSERHPKDVSVEAHTADIARLIDHLGGGPAIVVGQSFGGVVACVLAARRPQYVKALVVVEAGVSKPTEPAQARTIAWLRSWPVPFESRATAERYFGGPGTFGRIWASLLEERDGGLWPAFDVDTMQRTLASIRDYSRLWADISRPTLVVGGENGQIDKGELHQMANEVAGSYVEIPNAGHDVHLEGPERWKEVLRAFLDGL